MSINPNMDRWNSLKEVPKEHLKGFKRSGGFSGTAIKPAWQLQRMTEVFGMCGDGWGIEHVHFETMPGADGEVLVFCKVSIWVVHTKGEEASRGIVGVGGDKVIFASRDKSTRKVSALNSDDEAYKKAYTDALGNAFKMLGLGAMIHLGQYDGSKYIRRSVGNDPDAPYDNEDVTPQPKAVSREEYEGIVAGMRLIEENGTIDDLREYWTAHYDRVLAMPEDWMLDITAVKDDIRDNLKNKTGA